ncbi:MAG: RsmD family RNA methyltransferase, partial [Nitrososphaeria archaeon]
KVFLDLFAGSGAVGIEALSEGARFVYFVENNKLAVDVIRKNIVRFKVQDRCQVFLKDVLKFILASNLDKNIDYVFLDPPYKTHYASRTLEALANSDLISENSVIISEHSREEALSDKFIGKKYIEKFKEKRYGKIVVSYYIVK